MKGLNLNNALLKQMAKALGQEAGRDAVTARMAAAVPRIAKKMAKQGWTIGPKTETEVVRDALYRLWREVVPSGILADLIRDAHDDKVVAQLAEPVTETTPLEEIVRQTMAATLELAF